MTEAFAFGPFRLQVARRELAAHGVPVAIGQRAFDILLLLVSRHGQLVTKDELMAEVWPGVVVEENNIQVHVSALRKVLGKAGGGESYLRIRKRRWPWLCPRPAVIFRNSSRA
jgi:DNA-binding winged helix-turn-helix (wHTH) protein